MAFMQQDNLVFGFVIPVYNAEKYLEECLRSVIHQTYPNFYVYIIDDGSTDSSFAILKKFQLEDQRVILMRNRKNCGVSASRNRVLDRLIGDRLVTHILFVDSDDKIDQDLLLKLNKFPSSIEYVVFGTDFFNKKGLLRKHLKPMTCYLTKKEAINQLFLIGRWKKYSIKNWGLSNKVINVNLIRSTRFQESLSLAEDLEFVLKIFGNLHSGVFCNEVFYHYRLRASSITHSTRKVNYFQTLTFFMKHLDCANKSKRLYYKLAALQLCLSLYPRICCYETTEESKFVRKEYIPSLVSTKLGQHILLRLYMHTPSVLWKWLYIMLRRIRLKEKQLFP